MLENHLTTTFDLLHKHQHIIVTCIVLVYLLVVWQLIKQYATYAVVTKIQLSHKSGTCADEQPETTELVRKHCMLSILITLMILIGMSACIGVMWLYM